MFYYVIETVSLGDQSQIVQHLLLVKVFNETNKNIETLKVSKVNCLLDSYISMTDELRCDLRNTRQL